MQKKLRNLKFNYVAVRVMDSDRQTPGGIVLPESVEEELKFGTVVKVGPGRYESGVFVKPCVEVGDVIFFSRHSAGLTFKDAGEELVIFRDSEIYGTVE